MGTARRLFFFFGEQTLPMRREALTLLNHRFRGDREALAALSLGRCGLTYVVTWEMMR